MTGSVLVGRAPSPGDISTGYDAVVVGSGAGGLTAAVCLARQGRRVAVFEQHFTAGGYTHAYRRPGWEWDVGIHAGGEVFVRTPVARIELDGARASGVVLADGTQVRAPVVVSAAGAQNTFGTLLDDGDGERSAVMRRGFPFVLLFLGLDGDPVEPGLPRHNLMVTDGDCDAFFDGTGVRTSGLFLSFSCAKDPTWTAQHPGRSTGEILAYVQPELFEPFQGSRWRRRDPAYLALTAELTAELLDQLHRHLPRTRGRVAYHELGTPLTAEHFAGWPGGSLYGLAKDVAAFRDGRRPGTADWLRPRTGIDGLYLAGQDCLAGGFLGAVTGGLLAAHEALD
ncbi:phytoene desaturase family protein [Kitasatospora sp. NPDC006697]|uniref:phytoene desaturase family protein n=1 Tax=Kitasatospora sp. NPDC006697 TaxID=3364020 RepID=UPI0036B824A6